MRPDKYRKTTRRLINSAKVMPQRLTHWLKALPDGHAPTFPLTYLIISTSSISIAICGELTVAVVIPRLRHPRGPA